MKKITRNVLLVSTLIFLFSGCKKQESPIGDGYFIMKFKDGLNRDRIDTTYTTIGGVPFPFEEYEYVGYSALARGGSIININTNPKLSKNQYTSPSNTENLTSSNSFFIRFYEVLDEYDYLVKTGSLNLTDVIIKKVDFLGVVEEYIFVTGRWSGTWVNKTNNTTTNGELILVNACFPK